MFTQIPQCWNLFRASAGNASIVTGITSIVLRTRNAPALYPDLEPKQALAPKSAIFSFHECALMLNKTGALQCYVHTVLCTSGFWQFCLNASLRLRNMRLLLRILVAAARYRRTTLMPSWETERNLVFPIHRVMQCWLACTMSTSKLMEMCWKSLILRRKRVRKMSTRQRRIIRKMRTRQRWRMSRVRHAHDCPKPKEQAYRGLDHVYCTFSNHTIYYRTKYCDRAFGHIFNSLHSQLITTTRSSAEPYRHQQGHFRWEIILLHASRQLFRSLSELISRGW